MKEKIKTIFIILLMLISIYNLYSIFNCYELCNLDFYDGGLGKPIFYYGTSIIIFVGQIINIILLTKMLKVNEISKKEFIKIGITIIILIITFFIPVYGFKVVHPYNNLYNMSYDYIFQKY